jgi:hypothetical protein
VLLGAVLPEGVRVTVVADRGFADSKLFVFRAEELGFDYLIRLNPSAREHLRGGRER